MNINLFKAELAKKGYTQYMLANQLNIAPSTMVRKLKSNSFTLDEANTIIQILGITNPAEIFFSTK